MKNWLLAGIVVATFVRVGLALAAPDADPWETVNTQKEFTRPTKFDQQVDFAATTNLGVVDAGGIYVRGALQVAGAALLTTVSATSVTASSSVTAGSFPCDGGTPAPTVTVTSGVHCVCGGLGAACTVSSTTMTAHCVAGDTVGVGYLCL